MNVSAEIGSLSALVNKNIPSKYLQFFRASETIIFRSIIFHYVWHFEDLIILSEKWGCL